MEDFQENFIVLENETKEDEEETYYEGGKKKKYVPTDPYKELTVESFSQGGGRFSKKEGSKLFPAVTADYQNKALPKKAEETTVNVEEDVEVEPKQRVAKPKASRKKTSPSRKPPRAFTEKVKSPEPKRPLEYVVFEGSFGRMKAGYLDVYIDGMYLILVEKLAEGFSYSPPESDDPMYVTHDDVEYEVLSQGISFEMARQGIKTTVLLITGD